MLRLDTPRFAALMLLLMLGGCTSIDEDRWRLFNEDGVQQFAKGNYRDALESFDYAMNARPQDPVLLYNAGQCYERLGDVKRAEQLYVNCIQLNTKHGDAHLALVALQYRTARQAEANRNIEEWLRQDPPVADAFVADAWRLRQDRAYPATSARGA